MHIDEKTQSILNDALAELNNNAQESIPHDEFGLLIFQDMRNAGMPYLQKYYPHISEKMSVFISSQTGKGKSMITLHLLGCLLNGEDFYGAPYMGPKGGVKCAYIDGEMSRSTLEKRLAFEGITEYVKSGKLIIISRDFYIQRAREAMEEIQSRNACSTSKYAYLKDFTLEQLDKFSKSDIPCIDDDEGKAYYESLVKKMEIKVIAFDNLYFLMPKMRDSNSAEAWTDMNLYFLRLTSLGALVISVGHEGKNSKLGIAGSSAIIRGAGMVIEIKQHEESEKNKFKINLIFTKIRDERSEHTQDKAIWIEDGKWKYESLGKSRQEAILDCVSQELPTTAIINKIGEQFNIGRSTIYNDIKLLKDSGQIKDKGAGKLEFTKS